MATAEPKGRTPKAARFLQRGSSSFEKPTVFARENAGHAQPVAPSHPVSCKSRDGPPAGAFPFLDSLARWGAARACAGARGTRRCPNTTGLGLRLGFPNWPVRRPRHCSPARSSPPPPRSPALACAVAHSDGPSTPTAPQTGHLPDQEVPPKSYPPPVRSAVPSRAE